jgi:hypothetical protein
MNTKNSTKRMMERFCEKINISSSISESVNSSENKPINSSIFTPVDSSIFKPATSSIFKPINFLISGPVIAPISEPITLPISEPINSSISEPEISIEVQKCKLTISKKLADIINTNTSEFDAYYNTHIWDKEYQEINIKIVTKMIIEKFCEKKDKENSSIPEPLALVPRYNIKVPKSIAKVINANSESFHFCLFHHMFDKEYGEINATIVLPKMMKAFCETLSKSNKI